MIREYIDMALKRAHYEMIEDEEPFYGEVRELQGVWATGKTLEGGKHPYMIRGDLVVLEVFAVRV